MDNSFNSQGEFKPDGEFKPQGEFNAPEPNRQFVEIEPATAITLPYEKSSKVALLLALLGILFFVAGLVLLVPSLLSKLTLASGTTPYILLAIFSASALCYLIGILTSIKGVRAKFSKSIWAMAICCLLIVFPIIILIYSATVGNITQAFIDISKFLY